MVHALPREAHNLLSVRNMPYGHQLSITQRTLGKEAVVSLLEPGHTVMWLLGTSTISYYQKMATEKPPTMFKPNDRAEHFYAKKFLPRPIRSSITALRIFFGIAILAGSCTLSLTSLASAAELFPFSPPTSQQRAIDQPSQVRPQLSKEDIGRISRLADQAKKLTSDEQRQLQGSIRQKLKGAVTQGNLGQAQYYTELLTQIGQEGR